MVDYATMRMYLLTSTAAPVAEVAEYSDGSLNVRWLSFDATAQFPSMQALRAALLTSHPDWKVEEVPETPEQTVEPMAERLRRKRAEAGLSQRALARRLGVSFSTISRIEGGKNFVLSPALEAWLNEDGGSGAE